ncbi:MAG: MarR family winged helix-turn-helix transcriptional regulator [Pseudomonadota bacterium]
MNSVRPPTQDPSQAQRLHAHINALINLFLVNEKTFPSAQGRMRYSPLDFQTIRYVDAHPDCPAKAIADALGVAPTTLQSVLDRLIRKGYLERGDHPTDRRAKVHRLTVEGRALRDAIEQQDMENMQFLLGALTNDERERILALFDKIRDRINAVL